jgi:hypothetical protein
VEASSCHNEGRNKEDTITLAVTTVMQVARFIDPDWLVEVEVDAYRDSDQSGHAHFPL